MKKYVLVEVPEDILEVQVVCYRDKSTMDYPFDSQLEPPILHGKRALMEKCLKVGEFEGEYQQPRKGEPFLLKEVYLPVGVGKVIIQEAQHDCGAVCFVLTNLDESV